MKKINIKPGFLFLCLLIGGLYSSTVMEFLSWVIVIFGSVLFHECGHALTASCFGKRGVIELNMMGGVTYFSQEGLKKWQLFLIALNGPLFGYILFLTANYGLSLVGPDSSFFFALRVTSVINGFWTVFNLLPILPMDGGQLLRLVFEAVFKNKGLFYSAIVSVVLSLIMALLSFLVGQYLIGSVLFLFAFQNFELVKQARYLTAADREGNFRKLLQEGIYLYETGEIEKAKPLFEELVLKTKKGMIFTQATALLALIMKSKQDYKGVYHFLKPYPKLYETELAAVMHEAAFFQGDLTLVSKLSAEAFQKENTKEVACRSAIAAATFHQDEAALGWLKTAIELGLDEEEVKAHPLLKAYMIQIRP